MRSHVFPVCQTGSETKEWSNPIDSPIEGEIVNNSFLSENKDIVSIAETGAPNNVRFSHVALNQSKGEFLIDMPDVTYSGGAVVAGAVLFISFINRWSATSGERRVLEKNNFKPPTAGQVACIAVKRLDSVFLNSDFTGFEGYVHELGGDYFNFNYPFTEEGTYYFGLNQANPKVGGWITVMFTGTRWVLMGSNNWY